MLELEVKRGRSSAASWKQHDHACGMVVLTGYPVIVVVVVITTGEMNATP